MNKNEVKEETKVFKRDKNDDGNVDGDGIL